MQWINNPAAYCRHHRIYLNVKSIRRKQCLEKNCFHLQKLRHEWWIQLAELNYEKKLNKRRI